MNNLYLNIGSGQRPFKPPFINVDCQAKWNPDVVADGASMPMFADNSAKVIVLHHVLEHFGCGEAKALLTECHRILHPRGTIHVFVPDLWELASMWKEGMITDQVYATNLYGAYMGDEADRHKWGFTYNSLRALLQKCGFPWPFPAHATDPDLAMADIARDRWILGLTAYKAFDI